MHSGFEQFHAFDQDAIDNRAMLARSGKLKMPVLALGGEKSFGTQMAEIMRAGAENVSGGVVPASGPLDHGGEPEGDGKDSSRVSRQAV
jgi:hypothetical protein